MGTVYEFVTKMLVALQMTLPWVWQVLVGTGGYWWVLVGTGGYWWVLAMLWDVFEAHVVGRTWWSDNACSTGALIRPADLVNLEGLRTLS